MVDSSNEASIISFVKIGSFRIKIHIILVSEHGSVKRKLVTFGWEFLAEILRVDSENVQLHRVKIS